MEAEMGPQVVAPPSAALFHGVPPPGSLAKKNSSQKHDRSDPSSSPDSSSSDPSSSNWSPDMWRWDPVTFTMKPPSFAAAGRGTRTGSGDNDTAARGLGNNSSSPGNRDSPGLKLSNSSGSSTPGDSAARPNKRVRAESPDSGSRNKQMCCQVDDCNVDLAKQKDYYRRHKVCEIHSKAVEALVGKQMQRFCQQCSRFHPVADFDEGKRSCRARLAGHNRRRRKIRSEEAPSAPPVSSAHDGNASMSSKIVNVLAILAHIQDSNNLVMSARSSRVADVNSLDEVAGTLSSIRTSYSRKDLPICEKADLNVSHDPRDGNNSELPLASNKKGCYVSTSLDLCTATSNSLSTTKMCDVTPPSPVTRSSTEDKSEKNSLEPSSEVSSDNNSTLTVPNDGLNEHKDALPSTSEVVELTVHDTRPTLQLFGTTNDDLSLNIKCMSPFGMKEMMEKQCPSQPVTHNLFPLCPTTETSENGSVQVLLGENKMMGQTTLPRQNPSFEIFKDSVNIPRQNPSLSCGLSLGSSHPSPGSDLNKMDRTGRILFKLFDKHPSDIPITLRNQILNWLSHSPSDMESYIRPGCIVLSVYISMPTHAWDDLQKDLVSRLLSLLQCSDSNFWSSGRLLIDVDQKLAFHNDGKVGLCKHRKHRSAPELLAISPLAVVSGTEATLLLRGRNLRHPGTKIHCTYMGGYISKEVQGYHSPGTEDDESGVVTFLFPGGPLGSYGRCYIEVEHSLSGSSFPVIIADSAICEELVELEVELNGARNMIVDSKEADLVGPSLRNSIFYFLEELGWLFQRSNVKSTMCLWQFSVTRSMFLVLFAVERGWSALVKRLLDIFVQMSCDEENLAAEFLKAIDELHLLNRAVKGKCQKMVDMLLHYSIDGCYTSSKVYPFTPNSMGVGGITPLHLAASMEDSEDMIDALTNDPQGVGLVSWKCTVDDSGLSPHDYASLRNHHVYNRLVEGKLENRRNSLEKRKPENERSSEVLITICEEDIPSSTNSGGGMDYVQSKTNPSPSASCSQCAILKNTRLRGIIQAKSMKYRPYAHSLLAIAMVCMCVCLFYRGRPEISLVAPFKWENIKFGTM